MITTTTISIRSGSRSGCFDRDRRPNLLLIRQLELGFKLISSCTQCSSSLRCFTELWESRAAWCAFRRCCRRRDRDHHCLSTLFCEVQLSRVRGVKRKINKGGLCWSTFYL
uniref:(northern house mosquito) hypothetical protein n=1 Tax=Culex pipiens TaxID=7175 RepID=A0A8D8DBC8_CULPI